MTDGSLARATRLAVERPTTRARVRRAGINRIAVLPAALARFLAGPPGEIRCFIDRRSLRITSVLLSFAWTLSSTLAFAQQAPVAPGVNNITTTGLTATNVVTRGSVTTVTTNTVSGATGFNSFGNFQVGVGNTANLMLPNGTNNLVNLVRDSQVYVGGTLNSYKNGQVGGNVYFADPYGFVVGSRGVVNTGTLNITTPTRQFMDTVIGPNGQINNAAAAALMSGDIPVSPNGFVAIRGRVNTQNGASVVAQKIFVGAPRTVAEAANIVHANRFAASVNAQGLRSGAGIVAHNGSIRIVAAGGANINGRLTARRGNVSVAAPKVSIGQNARLSTRDRKGNAGNISVTASRDIAVAGGARLDAASGAGNAGNITVKAGHDLSVASGATFDASAAAGNGGTVELSARNVATVGAINAILTAPHGTAGTLLLDPYDLVITSDAAHSPFAAETACGGGVTANCVSFSANIATGGGNAILLADHSITIESTGIIDTRNLNAGQSVGNSGNITLTAPTIAIKSGAQLLADVSTGSTFRPGDIALTASTLVSVESGSTVRGGNLAVGGGAGTLATITWATNYASQGRDISLAATTVTLDPAAVLDVRTLDGSGQIAGNSGNISLLATTLTNLPASANLRAGSAPSSNFSAGTITLQADNLSLASGFTTSGASLTLVGGTSVTLAAGAAIDTRILDGAGASAGSSGGIALVAPTVTIASGARLSAQVDAGSTFNPGTLAISASTQASVAGTLAVGEIGVSAGTLNWSSSVVTDGRSVSLSAATLTLDPSVTIDTRNLDASGASVGGSGDITLAATTALTNGIPANGKLLAYVTPGASFTAGTITIETADLGIAGNIATQGASIVLHGDQSLTLAAGVTIDTRSLDGQGATAGNAGNISVWAPTLTIPHDNQLLAFVGANSTYHAGTITLRATDIDLEASATSANSTYATHGASLVLQADNSVTVGSPVIVDTRNLDPQGHTAGNSGNIALAGVTVTVQSGAQLDAQVDAGSAYSAGNVTVTAAGQASVAGSLSGNNITVLAGEFVWGNTAIVFDDGANSGALSTLHAQNLITHGGSVDLQAQNSITVAANGLIDTRALNAGGVTAGDSGNITLTAPTITIQGGGQLLADVPVGSVFRPGDITLNATTLVSVAATATVKGGTLTVGPPSPVIALGVPITQTLAEIDWSTGYASQGRNISLAATTINLASGVTLDARSRLANATIGNAGNITLSATTLTNGVPTSNALRADVDAGSGFTAGTISLAASTITLSQNFSTGGANLAVSAANTLSIGAGVTLDAGSGTVSLSGTNGVTVGGTVLGGALTVAASSGTIDWTPSYASHGGDISFTAPTIKLANTTTLDARNLNGATVVGNSGDISLLATTLTNGVPSSANLLAGVASGSAFSAGTVTLQASNLILGSNFSTGGANLSLQGGAVTINAGVAVDTGNGGSGAGSFAIAASTSATVAGTIAADAVSVSAGTLTWSGGAASNGHDITLAATGTLSMTTGTLDSRRLAAGATAGDSGDISLSAATLSIPGDTSFKAYVDPNSAYNAGTMTLHASTLSLATSFSTKGASVVLHADNSLTVGGGVVIDTRNRDGNGLTVGNSGNITLWAPTLANGIPLDSHLLAGVGASSAYKGGTITLHANSLDLETASTSANSTYATKGASLVLQADNSLTIGGSVIIDARNVDGNAATAGNAGSITLQAPTLTDSTIQDSRLLAYVDPLSTYRAGTITLHGGSLTVASNFSTKGANLALIADDTLTLATTATIDTRNRTSGGASGGDSGSITLVAPTFANGLPSNSKLVTDVDVNSTYLSGSINIDTQAALDLANTVFKTFGGYFKIASDSSISIENTATLDTRWMRGTTVVGAAGDVVLTVNASHTAADTLDRSITIAGILNAGNVTLSTTTSNTFFNGDVVGNASIIISGQVTAANFTATTSGTGIASFQDVTAAFVPLTAAFAISGLAGGYVAGASTSVVSVRSGASINATGDVALNANSKQESSDPAITTLGLSPLSIAVAVGILHGTTTAEIQSGATVHAGGNLSVTANSNSKINLTSISVSGTADAAVAWAQADVNTTAQIAAGSAVSSSGAVKVVAHNDTSFQTSATAIALNGGVAGIALAYTDLNTNATATVGTSLGDATHKIGSLQVEASSTSINNAAGSTVIVGNNIVLKTLAGGAQSGAGFLSKTLGDALTSTGSITLPLKFGSAVTVGQSDFSANASIAGPGGGTAPSIFSTGSVAVVSVVQDIGVRRAAASSVESESTDPSSTNPAAVVGISAGVAVGLITHNSNAWIGPDVAIVAGNIAVGATTYTPITNRWLDWDGLGEVLSHLNGTLGVAANILTSFANASAAGQVALAGSVDYFKIENNTTAWVAHGAHLTQAGGSATWATTLFDGSQQAWAGAIAINASTDTESINVAGNVGLLLTGAGGQGANGKAIGGTAAVAVFDSTTIAGIADGAVVSSDTSVAVNSAVHDVVFTITPTSGVSAGSLSLNGAVSVVFIDNTTHASISSTAQVSAPEVDVGATQAMSMLSVSGAVAASQGTGVGLSTAILFPTTDTFAYVGDNSADMTNSAIDPAHVAAVGGGFVHADSLDVNAATSGEMTVAAVAMAVSSPKVQGSFKDTLTGPSTPASAEASGANSKALSLLGLTKQGTKAPSGKSLDLAGSASVTQTEIGTHAAITAATIDRYSASGSTADTVEAINNTILANGSGSAALDLTGRSKAGSAAVAGAVAVAITDNSTTAAIANSDIEHTAAVNVQALAGGQATVVGIGLSGSNAPTGGSASISVSVGVFTDTTTATIENSQINASAGVTGPGRAVNVAAYQTTNIGIGGGSLYFGGVGGFGAALTYTSISDPSGGLAVDAHIRNTSIAAMDTVTVSAIDSAVIGSGAGAGGFVDKFGLSGAIVINFVTPTISASITGDAAAPKVMTVTGSISVIADGGRVSAFDATIASAGARADGSRPVNDSGIDFTASDVNSGALSPGAAIVAVAGVLQLCSTCVNVGVSILDNTIGVTRTALIADVLIKDPLNANVRPNVTVQANDNATLIGVAVGLGGSDEALAGVGSIAVNRIHDTVGAGVGDATSTITNTEIDAATLRVAANDNVRIVGAAGSGAGGTASVGLSVVYDGIGNTLSAGINGAKVIASRDVVVDAESTANILTVSIGIALAEVVGIAGSVATSILTTDVNSSITGSADVNAGNNVAVLAGNKDTIQVVTGAAGVGLSSTGVGLSVVVDQVGGDTNAFISGSGTKVDAGGALGAAGAVAVNNGTLVQPISVASADDPNLTSPNMTENTTNVSGLAVVATSHQSIVGDAVTLGVSTEFLTGDALALVPVVSLSGGTTKAYVDSAKIDTRLTAAAASGLPQVYVGAGSVSYSRNLVIAVAISGGLAGAGSASGNRMERETDAYMQNATVGGTVNSAPTVGDVTVRANATQVASDIVIGGGFAVAGAGAASIIVNVFDATTKAYVDGGNVTASSLSVTANSQDGYFAAAGAGAGAALIAIAGAFVIGVSSDTTQAYVGDASQDTVVNLGGDLTVTATATSKYNSFALGGTAAGGTSIAGMFDLSVIDNTTTATLDRVRDTQTGGGNVTVTATESVTITPTTGAGALSTAGLGFGAGVNVVLLKSEVGGSIVDSTISTAGAVSVGATGTKDIEAMTVTVGAGASAGIGAAIGIVLVGTSAPVVVNDEISTSTAAVNNFTNGSPPGNGISQQGLPGSTETAAQIPGPLNVIDQLGGKDDTVTAAISGGSTGAGSVTVDAQGNVSTANTATGVGVGGVGGVGAAVGYTLVNDKIAATVGGGTVTAGAVTVTAGMDDGTQGSAAKVQAFAGAGGLAAAIGAAVAHAEISNSVSAQLGGTVTGDNTGVANVTATDTSSVNAKAVGATLAGGVAVGISLAFATKGSLVYATLPEGASISGYQSVNLTATGSGAVTAMGVAGAGGGLASGAGVLAQATDSETIIAEIGTQQVAVALHQAAPTGAAPVFTGAGAVTLAATATPEVSTQAIGVAVAGGVGLGASVSQATADVKVFSQVDDGVLFTGSGLSVTASTLLPTSGYSVNSDAIAGAGGQLVGAQATVSQASNTSTVFAALGDGVGLPTGVVTISATNTTSQKATGTGVAAGGLLAIGVVVTEATADTNTTAAVGNSLLSPMAGMTSFSLTALGTDTDYAKAIAGAGGYLAGSGSNASTSDTSNVFATVGTNTAILANNSVTIDAEHTDNFKAISSSVNAAVVGGSASLAGNSANSTVEVDIGAGAQLMAIGTGGAGCSTCPIAVGITTKNTFVETGTDASTDAAAGGGINGAGATSTTGLTGNSNIRLGANVGIASTQGSINIQASTSLDAQDTAQLSTGGAIQGAGVNSTIRATLNNLVTLADSADNDPNATSLTAQGTIVVSTFTHADVGTTGLVSTWGLAAVGDVVTVTDITSNQTVTIGHNATLNAIGEVYVTPGLVPLGAQFGESDFTASSDAEGYVRGLIAVPLADATSTVTSNAALTIASGAVIQSAQNIGIGAYHGSPTIHANGTGHGYELGFIPVTDGDQHPNAVTTSSVQIDGNVTAGVYHDQEVRIDCGSAACGPTSNPTLTLLSGAPLIVNNTILHPGDSITLTGAAFDAYTFVQQKFDAEVSNLMAQGVTAQGALAPAFMLGQLFAVGGTVTINADAISGTGTVTSYGSPQINVVNNSNAYLVLSSAFIPDVPGAKVIFTGVAKNTDAAVAGIHINEVADTAGSLINVALNYTGDPIPNSTTGPALFNTGDLSNLGGGIALFNASGWFGQLGQVIARSVSETAPNGGLVVSLLNPGSMFSPGPFPYTDWQSYMNFPGPAGASAVYNNVSDMNAAAPWAVAWAANLFAAQMPQRLTDAQKAALNNPTLALNLQLYGDAGNIVPYCFAFGCFPVGNLQNIGTYQTFTSYGFFGSCAFNQGGTCGFDAAKAASLIGQVYNLTPLSTSGGDRYNSFQPMVPVITGNQGSVATNGYLLTAPTYASVSLGSAGPGIKADGPIAVKADIININNVIESGRSNFWSVSLPASLDQAGGFIANYRQQYQQGLVPAVVDIPSLTVKNAGDQLIGAKYDASTNSIIVNDVVASTGGGFVQLDGKIINTRPLGGLIKVNGGLGQVAIDNQTDLSLVVNKVDNGSTTEGTPVTSRVKIIDRLISDPNVNTTTYIFDPNQGVNAYITANGADPILTGPHATQVVANLSGLSNTSTYNPVAGARFQWDQVAFLSRSTDGYVPTGPWLFSSSNGANPWWFLTPSGQLVSEANAQGQVILDQPGGPAFKQTISATVHNPWGYGTGLDVWHGYGGCGDVGSSCNYGFIRNDLTGAPYAGWDYNFPTNITLHLTSSAKADNPIGILFNGSGTAALSVTSAAAVTFSGRVTNPNGTTSVATTGGGITESLSGSLATKNIDFTTPGAIGSSAQPFQATITNNGAVRAQAGQAGVYLKLNSDANLDRVAAGNAQSGYGDVVITASGNLLRADQHVDGSAMNATDANVIGNNITLTSLAGSVGTADVPVVISANSTMSAGQIAGGVVNVAAMGDVALTQQSGDMRLGLVASLSGDVYLNVPQGSLVSANAQTAAAALSPQQVTDFANALHLTDGANIGTNAIAAFENLVAADLVSYGRLATQGSVGQAAAITDAALVTLYRSLYDAAQVQLARTTNDPNFRLDTPTDAQVLAFATQLNQTNGTFVLNSAAIAVYRPFAAAALGVTNPTDAQVQAYANAQYQNYANVFTQAYGATWKTQAKLADPNILVQDYNALFDLRVVGSVTNGTLVLNGDAGVRAYAQTALTSTDYTSFQTLLQNGAANNGSFTLTNNAVSIKAIATLLGLSQSSSYAIVQAVANTRYQSLAQTVGTSANTRYQSANADLTFKADATLQATLSQDAVWDPNQLASAIDRSALQPVAIVVGNGAPNIVARNIVLITGNSIGALAPSVTITLADLASGNLTTGQQAALATATTPGSVTLTGQDANGQTVSGFDITNAPAGVTIKSLQIAQTAPVFINAAGNVTISAGGSAYLQSTSTSQAAGATLTIARIAAGLGGTDPGTINLQAPQGILVGTPDRYGIFTLGAAGIATYAQPALGTTNYATYTSLTNAANGSVQNGTLVLTTAGINLFRSAAATALHIANPTDAQVQAYANQQYQGYVQTTQIYANAIYQALARKVQVQLAVSGLIQSGTFLLTDAGVLRYAAAVLNGSDLAKLQGLVAQGTVTSGKLVLSDAAVAADAQAVLGGSYSSFASLLQNGSLHNGVLVLSDAGVAANASAALTPSNKYGSFANLLANGTARNGTFVLSDSGIASFAPTALTANDLATFQLLVNAANASLQSGKLVLTDAGIARFAQNALVASYQDFKNLTDPNTYGSVASGTVTLTSAGVSHYAAIVLSSDNYSLFQSLTNSANGTLANGTVTLNATGLGVFSSKALSATDNTTYQAFAAAVHSGAVVLSDSQVATYSLQALYSKDSNTFAILVSTSNSTVSSGALTLKDAGVANLASTALGSAYTRFQALTGTNGTVSNGVVTLTDAGVAANAQAALASPDYTSFQTLLANSTVSGGVLTIKQDQTSLNNLTTLLGSAPTTAALQTAANTLYQSLARTTQTYGVLQYQSLAGMVRTYANNGSLNDAGVAAQAAAALTNAYTNFQGLTGTFGTVGNGALTLTDAGVANNAQAALTSANYTKFQALTGNGAVSSGTYNLTNNSTAISNVAAALGISSSDFTTVQNAARTFYTSAAATTQTYGATQYQTLAGMTQTFAGTEYQGYAGATQTYANTTYNADVLVIQNYANSTYFGFQLSAQNYANTQYLTYAQTTTDYANQQYQGFAQTTQTYANKQYQGLAQTTQDYANAQYLGFVTTIQNTVSGQYQTLAQQVQNQVAASLQGAVQKGAFIPDPASVRLFAPEALSIADDTTLNGLFAGNGGSGQVSLQALTSTQIATSGNLTLAGGSGSIGDRFLPITYQIGGDLAAASSQNNVYLRAVGGDAQIGRVLAQNGIASINSVDGAILSYLPGVAVKASSIELVAKTDIGTAGTPFNVQTDEAGALTGSAGGIANLYGPTIIGQPLVDLHVSTFTAVGALTIGADNDLFVQSATSTQGDVTLFSKGNATLTSVSAAGNIDVTTLAGLTAASLSAATGHIFVTATGNASVASASVTDTTGSEAITLKSIGADLQVGSVTGPGAIELDAVGTLTVTANGRVTSSLGMISATADAIAMASGAQMSAATTLTLATNGTPTPTDTTAGSFTMASGAQLLAGGDLTVTTTGLLTAAMLTSAAGNILVDASGTLTVVNGGTVTSSLGSIDVTAGAIAMQSGAQMAAHTTLTAATNGTPTPTDTTAGSLAMDTGAQLLAGGNLTVTTTGLLTAATLTSTAGNILVTAAGNGSIDTASVTATTGSETITLKSTGGDLQVGTVTGPGAIELDASGTLGVAGNRQVASLLGSITGTADAIAMQSGAQMSAATTIDLLAHTGTLAADTLTATSGPITLTATQGDIAARQVTIGNTTGTTGTITFTAGGGVALGQVTAPGMVSVLAGGGITITPTGVITSRNDLIEVSGLSLAMGAGSKMSAAGTITIAATTNAVLGQLTSALAPTQPDTTTISVTAGDSTHAGQILGNGDGQVNIVTARPNAAVVLASRSGIGSAAVPLSVNVPWLSATATTGDIYISGFGDINVKTLSAPGTIGFSTTGSLSLDHIKASTITLQAGTTLDFVLAEVSSSITLRAMDIAGTIVQPQPAPGPLFVTVTGPNGTIANTADLTIDPPVTIMPQLFVTDATITNNGPSFTIQQGLVPGQLTLNVPGQLIVMNNRSPVPMGFPTLQLWQPGTMFSFSQNGNYDTTTGFVVDYSLFTNSTAVIIYAGGSFVRDFPREQRNGEIFDWWSLRKDGNTFYSLGVSPDDELEAGKVKKWVDKVGQGPAVNLDGLN
jgi:hypothetical protein